MKKWIKFYNDMVGISFWLIHVFLIILGLYLIWKQMYVSGSLVCMAEGIWGIENQLVEMNRRKDE